MDALITAAGRALTLGDPLGALNRVSLREDPPALALRGVAMAQLGEFATARSLLRRAGRVFGAREPVARARCLVAAAEIALVLRDLNEAMDALDRAQPALARHGDRVNAAHAGYLQARCLLVIGRLDEAEARLSRLDIQALPLASRAGALLVAAGIAMRRIKAKPARTALDRAATAAHEAGIPALVAEVEVARRALHAPGAMLSMQGESRPLQLETIEALIASNALIVDALRHRLRLGDQVVSLAGRPTLFALLRALAEAWPGDAARETLLRKAFDARFVDESHRARLRVEIGRLRSEIGPLAAVVATERGFILQPLGTEGVAILAPLHEQEHADVLALLADGEAWSSSALALALDVSPRTVLRAIETLAVAGKIDALGHGRARRWILRQAPGFPTGLLLSTLLPAR
ncbi:helix-turn-helix domain-containing protein [Brevundimonas faecalis]|uniref:helix-turn-helix domain-containing protein n=1 Tax=Brevundimonas faecalis TaxID=947378 RepID=UPI00360C9A2A